MKNALKQAVRKSVTGAARVAGFDFAFARRRQQTDYVMVDRNALEEVFNNGEYMQRYYDGLRRSGVEHTDNFFKQCRHYTLQQLLESLLAQGKQGNVAECGCWKGQSAYIISSLLAKYNFQQQFSIFDSFEGGLSEKNERDGNARLQMTEAEIEFEKNHFASAEQDLHRALAGFDFYKLYKGWIPDRFAEVAEQEFMFAHIDVDLYQPTLDSLEFFYPRLIPGGVIVIDDYGYTQFPGCKAAVDEFLQRNSYTQFLAGLPGGSFIVK